MTDLGQIQAPAPSPARSPLEAPATPGVSCPSFAELREQLYRATGWRPPEPAVPEAAPTALLPRHVPS